MSLTRRSFLKRSLQAVCIAVGTVYLPGSVVLSKPKRSSAQWLRATTNNPETLTYELMEKCMKEVFEASEAPQIIASSRSFLHQLKEVQEESYYNGIRLVSNPLIPEGKYVMFQRRLL
jgi:hypothetical protein